MIILGIETSCDETAVSVVEANGTIENPIFNVLGSSLHSQIDLHKKYGGVVPNLAKREHIRNLPIVLDEALSRSSLDLAKIDAIAVTVGPGLEPALWTGISFAKELSEKLGVEVIPTNHMEGHIASVLTGGEKIEFPALSLLVSGGHTELVFIENWKNKNKIGETQDDAVGEAFDKVARMLGLPYPGGPEISKLAVEAREKGLSLETKFPRPMIHSGDFNFSFSGLKTAVLYYIRNITGANIRSGVKTERGQVSESNISDDEKKRIAREFEDAAVETLVSKTKAAVEKYSPKTLIVGGGVVSNTELRKNIESMAKNYPGMKVMLPGKGLATDNAVMIAIAGYIEYLNNSYKNSKLEAKGNLDI